MMLNWSWSGKFLAINEAPFIIGSLSLQGFMFDASRWERVDGAARDAIDAARATTRDATAVGREKVRHRRGTQMRRRAGTAK